MHSFATVLLLLIDEIENAGIDKEKSICVTIVKEKLVMIVTHDPHTAFMAKQRIVMESGTIKQVIQRSRTEEETFHQLSKEYRKQKICRMPLEMERVFK